MQATRTGEGDEQMGGDGGEESGFIFKCPHTLQRPEAPTNQIPTYDNVNSRFARSS